MRVDKVKYTAQYEAGRKVTEWIGIEASPDEGETADEAFKAAQGKVNQWHKENNPHLDAPMYGQPIPDMQVDAPKSRNQTILAGISTCNDITVLKSYYLIAKQDEATLMAYNKKLEELSK